MKKMLRTALATICTVCWLASPTPGLARITSPASCATSTLIAGQHEVTIISEETQRVVLVFVPKAVKAGRALPLVIDLHGSGRNAAYQAAVSRMAIIGNQHGFIVANPSGGVTDPVNGTRHYWNIPGVPLTGNTPVPADAPDDVQFIAQLIDQLAAKTCVDQHRVYVTGMSGGARMTSLLACQMSSRVAAIAPVDGLRAGLPLASDAAVPDPASCQPERPMPIVTFHGTGDAVNPYAGGGYGYWRYGTPAALQRWVEIDRCKPAPQLAKVAAHVQSVRYTGCAGGAEILFYRIDAPDNLGGGHTWPGSSPPSGAQTAAASASRPSREISASDLIWQFLSRFRLPD
jgi:polyhydroxybutyrate depolymerase